MIALALALTLAQIAGNSCGVAGEVRGCSGGGTTVAKGLYIGLTSYYAMNNSDGGVLVPDEQGNNDLVTVASPKFTTDAGIVGLGFGCIGSSMSSDTTSTTLIPLKTEFSISVWVRVINPLPSAYGAVVVESSSNGIFVVAGGTGLVKLSAFYGGADHFSGTFPYATWTHLVVIATGGTLVSYINGTFDRTIAASGYVGMSFRYSGFDKATDQFKGDLDELGFWGRALTQAEVTYLYNGGAGRTTPFQ